MEEGRTYVNSLRRLPLQSFPPPLTVLPLREQWFNPDVLNKNLPCTYTSFKYL